MSLRPAGHAEALRVLLRGVELLHSTAPESGEQLAALLRAEQAAEAAPGRPRAGFQDVQKKKAPPGKEKKALEWGAAAARKPPPAEGPNGALGLRGKGVAKKSKGKGGSRLDSLRHK